MSEPEYHVASYVLRHRPDAATGVTRGLGAITGVEIHARAADRMVVTAEAEGVRTLAEIASRLEQIDGVLAVAPVYHEFDPPCSAQDARSDGAASAAKS